MLDGELRNKNIPWQKESRALLHSAIEGTLTPSVLRQYQEALGPASSCRSYLVSND